MKLIDYQDKIRSLDRIDDLERDSIIVCVFNILTKATLVLFPNGAYKKIKWYQFNRWVVLGKLMFDLVRMVMSRKS
jgi:hypothetical protein